MKNQKSIPTTTISFHLPVIPHLLRKLRGAVVESVMSHKAVFEAAGIATELFHNHKEMALTGADNNEMMDSKDPSNRHWDYPLVQYKVHHRKAEIMGIGAGAQALQLWMSLVGDTIMVAGKEVSLSIREHNHIQWQPTLEEKPTLYRLNKWLPFNPKNYELWQNTPKLTDKAKILDKLIWGHLFHLLESLEITIDRKQLSLYVSTIDMQSFKDCFDIKKLALDITFYTNLNLPEEIGLGQGISIGFGKVQKINRKKRK